MSRVMKLVWLVAVAVILLCRSYDWSVIWVLYSWPVKGQHRC